jgi:hypothetical protein
MTGCLLYRSETQRAQFNNVVLFEESDVPKIKVFQTGVGHGVNKNFAKILAIVVNV